MLTKIYARLTAVVFPALLLVASALATAGFAEEPSAEHYEIRTYKIFDFEKQQIADQFLEKALLPALNRQGIEKVGVFHNLKDENDHSIFVIIPWSSMDAFASSNAKLSADTAFQEASKSYIDSSSSEDKVFDRIESRLLVAFDGMKTMELSDASKNNTDRIFELRLYESASEELGRLKVEMFNNGEIQLMRDVGLGPIFFGETIVGGNMPNLVYMLGATDEDAHKEHWKAFLDSPKWAEMKEMPKYKGTVSKIENWFLKPAPYSQL